MAALQRSIMSHVYYYYCYYYYHYKSCTALHGLSLSSPLTIFANLISLGPFRVKTHVA